MPLTKRDLAITASGLGILAASFFRAARAATAWQRRWPGVALALNRGDAEFAMQIGNYYFAGTAGRSEYDLGRAKRSFQLAVSLDPTILWGHYQLARTYLVRRDRERALPEANSR